MRLWGRGSPPPRQLHEAAALLAWPPRRRGSAANPAGGRPCSPTPSPGPTWPHSGGSCAHTCGPCTCSEAHPCTTARSAQDPASRDSCLAPGLAHMCDGRLSSASQASRCPQARGTVSRRDAAHPPSLFPLRWSPKPGAPLPGPSSCLSSQGTPPGHPHPLQGSRPTVLPPGLGAESSAYSRDPKGPAPATQLPPTAGWRPVPGYPHLCGLHRPGRPSWRAPNPPMWTHPHASRPAFEGSKHIGEGWPSESDARTPSGPALGHSLLPLSPGLGSPDPRHLHGRRLCLVGWPPAARALQARWARAVLKLPQAPKWNSLLINLLRLQF